MSETFQKNVEDFECVNCSSKVTGNGYTDHCPKCLYSLHVDMNPGDRASTCGGKLLPTNIAPFKSGYKIFYTCEKCGIEHTNKSAQNDDITSFLDFLKSK